MLVKSYYLYSKYKNKIYIIYLYRIHKLNIDDENRKNRLSINKMMQIN